MNLEKVIIGAGIFMAGIGCILQTNPEYDHLNVIGYFSLFTAASILGVYKLSK